MTLSARYLFQGRSIFSTSVFSKTTQLWWFCMCILHLVNVVIKYNENFYNSLSVRWSSTFQCSI